MNKTETSKITQPTTSWLDAIKLCADNSPEKYTIVKGSYNHVLQSAAGIYRRKTREEWLTDECALYVDSSCFRDETAVQRVAKAVAAVLKSCDYEYLTVVVFSDNDCESTEFELSGNCDFYEIVMPEEKATDIKPALEHFCDERLDDTMRFRIIVTRHKPAEDFQKDYDYNLVPTVIVLLIAGKTPAGDDEATEEEFREDGPLLLRVGREELLSSLPRL